MSRICLLGKELDERCAFMINRGVGVVTSNGDISGSNVSENVALVRRVYEVFYVGPTEGKRSWE